MTIEEATTKYGTGVRAYIPSLTEVEALAIHEEMMVREAAKLEALQRRLCVGQRAGAALVSCG